MTFFPFQRLVPLIGTCHPHSLDSACSSAQAASPSWCPVPVAFSPFRSALYVSDREVKGPPGSGTGGPPRSPLWSVAAGPCTRWLRSHGGHSQSGGPSRLVAITSSPSRPPQATATPSNQGSQTRPPSTSSPSASCALPHLITTAMGSPSVRSTRSRADHHHFLLGSAA